MGLDINRFADIVDEELKCSICLNVLESPVNGPCGHVFCRQCIYTWLESGVTARSSRGSSRSIYVSGTCPVDRKSLFREELIEAAIPLRAILSKLKIRCDFHEYGCQSIVTVGSLKDHVKVCNFNPEEVIQCQNGCAKLFARKNLINRPHNCIRELKSMITFQERIIDQLETDKHYYEKLNRNLQYLVMLLILVISYISYALYCPVSLPV
jgi:E3 ubiquitin-protein ligase NRDP1